MLKCAGRWPHLVFGILAVCLVAVLPPTAAQAQTAVKAPPASNVFLTIVVDGARGIRIEWQRLPDPPGDPTILSLRDAPSPAYCAADTGAAWCATRAGKCRCHDLPGVYNTLVRMQRDLSKPNEPLRRLHLTASPQIPLEVIVSIIDVARCHRGLENEAGAIQAPPGGFDRLEDYHRSVPVPSRADAGNGRCKPLLPQVVFMVVD